MIYVAIPAHNEADGIVDTLLSVKAQTVQPDRRLVMADNCTDDTVSLAEVCGWEVRETVGNLEKKGGALNQAWDYLSSEMGDDDYLVVMDADTLLAPDFIEKALGHFEKKDKVGGVCATFEGKPLDGSLGVLQRMEYARFNKASARRRGVVSVVAGAAAVFPVWLLRQIVNERGYLYAHVLTEDFELSLAIRTRGYKVYAPKDCRAYTDLMPDIKALWRQRIRWYRGTIQELRVYGWSKVTRRDILMQGVTLACVGIRWLFIAALCATLFLVGGLEYNPIWAIPLPLFALERAMAVRSLGWAYQLAAVLLVEEIYGFFKEIVFLRSLWLAYFGRSDWVWHRT